MPSSRIATRTSNADKHPGLQGKRKRRTKAEMDEDRQLKAEEKERKKSDNEKKIARIAVLENKMAVEDVETREAPAPRPHPRPLRRTSSHAQIPLYTDASDEPVVR
jgi:hypothetical protein